MRGELVLEPVPRGRPAVLTHTDAVRVLERVRRVDVRSVDLGDVDLAGRRRAGQIDRRPVGAVPVAVDDADRELAPAFVARGDDVEQGEGPEVGHAVDAAVRPLLRRRAYLPLPRNVHFMVRMPAGGPTLPQDLASFWLTRGDSEADEAF